MENKQYIVRPLGPYGRTFILSKNTYFVYKVYNFLLWVLLFLFLTLENIVLGPLALYIDIPPVAVATPLAIVLFLLGGLGKVAIAYFGKEAERPDLADHPEDNGSKLWNTFARIAKYMSGAFLILLISLYILSNIMEGKTLDTAPLLTMLSLCSLLWSVKIANSSSGQRVEKKLLVTLPVIGIKFQA